MQDSASIFVRHFKPYLRVAGAYVVRSLTLEAREHAKEHIGMIVCADFTPTTGSAGETGATGEPQPNSARRATMHIFAVEILAVFAVFLVILALVTTRSWERCPDLWFHLTDCLEVYCGGSRRLTAAGWRHGDRNPGCIAAIGCPPRLLLLLLRATGVLLLASGFWSAPARNTWDYPNAFVGFPLGVFLLLLSFERPGRSRTRPCTQRASIRILHGLTAGFVATVQLAHLFFVPTEECAGLRLLDGGVRTPTSLCLVNVMHLFVAVGIGSTCLASSVAAFSPPPDQLRSAWRLARGAHGFVAANVLLARLVTLGHAADFPIDAPLDRTVFGFALLPSPVSEELRGVGVALLWLLAVLATQPSSRAWLAVRCGGAKTADHEQDGLSLASFDAATLEGADSARWASHSVDIRGESIGGAEEEEEEEEEEAHGDEGEHGDEGQGDDDDDDVDADHEVGGGADDDDDVERRRPGSIRIDPALGLLADAGRSKRPGHRRAATIG